MRIVRRDKPDLERQLAALLLVLRSSVKNCDGPPASVRLDHDPERGSAKDSGRCGTVSVEAQPGTSAL